MNTTTKLAGGAVAACVACCAISVLPAVLASSGLLAVGGATWGLGAALVAVPAGAMYLLSRRQPASPRTASTLTPVASCGCSTCAPSGEKAAPIACTLDAGDFRERTSSIRDLARRSLRHASRTPLSLTLTYDTNALGEVRELVRKEKDCCAFLDFDLKSSTEAVRLTITAPREAADAADALFAHFAPHFASTKETA